MIKARRGQQASGSDDAGKQAPVVRELDNSAMAEQLGLGGLTRLPRHELQHPEAEFNNALPGAASILAQLDVSYSVPDADGGLFTATTCNWVQYAQMKLGIDSSNPGRLDDHTLQALEDHVRWGETDWERVGLVRTEIRDTGRGERGRFEVGVDASLLQIESTDPAALYEHYARVVALSEGAIPETNGQPQRTILGIRGLAKDAAATSTPLASRDEGYRDMFVVLKPDRTAEVFAGSTMPSSMMGELGQDIDGDYDRRTGMGRDSSTLRTGAYVGEGRGHWYDGQSPAYNLFADQQHAEREDRGDLPVWRNRSAAGEGDQALFDGPFRPALADMHLSLEDRMQAEQRGDTGGEIIFHAGALDGPSSVGCQTLHPEEYENFVRAMGDGDAAEAYDRKKDGESTPRVGTSGTDFRFVLIEARDFLLRNPQFGSSAG